MKLTVVLGASEEASFDIHLNDNSFVRKWTKELQWCTENCEFNQQEAFWSLLTLDESSDILTNACLTINQYLKNFIEVRSDLANQPQEYFNYLHTKFETLSGEYGKPTRLFAMANTELKTAIRNLNFFIHRVETKQDPDANLYISFNKDQYRRHPLEQDDYQYAEYTIPPGTLFLHYVELGKNLFDLYKDGLDLSYPGFKNLHYFSGEATLTLAGIDQFDNKDYIDWLTNQGLDPYNKHMGHVTIPLGNIINIETVKDKLSKYKHINQILIKED